MQMMYTRLLRSNAVLATGGQAALPQLQLVLQRSGILFMHSTLEKSALKASKLSSKGVYVCEDDMRKV